MTPRRWQLIKDTLGRRQPDLTVVMDRVHKMHNFSAIVRSCDAVGIHEAHLVPSTVGITPSAGLAQGSQKWVKIRRHQHFAEVAAELKARGMQLLAAHAGESSRDFRSVDLTQPTAIVLGTELYGMQEESLALCDGEIKVPMHGMVESLNVSVACALILYEAERQRMAAGLYGQSRLQAEEYRACLFEWGHPKLAQYCREKGLDYPELDENGDIIGKIPGSASHPVSQEN